MENKEIRFQKVRDLGQIMSDSFDFIKQEIRPLSRIILIYVLPFVILYAGAQVYFQRNVLVHFDLGDPESIMANIGPFYSNLFIFIFFGLFIQSLLAGTYFTYIDAYIKKGKDKFAITDISGHFFHNSLLAFASSVVFTFIAFLGAIFFIVPGIYFANSLSLMVFITVFSKKGIGHALSQSWSLVRTQWWNTFLINLIGLMIVYAVGVVFSMPATVMGVAGGITAAATDSALTYPDWYWVLTAISSAVTSILLIIPFTFQAFQYFNLEERVKPKKDIQSSDFTI
ncbi:MAG TPA: hypothetical protein PK904_18675 [Bacteroidales bacterium]|nr:hypothetical protein [Bacteroidales bacterium]